ncbi:hypothetical protein SVIOM342S_05459 [Streptomyces violaceorubidus]
METSTPLETCCRSPGGAARAGSGSVASRTSSAIPTSTGVMTLTGVDAHCPSRSV